MEEGGGSVRGVVVEGGGGGWGGGWSLGCGVWSVGGGNGLRYGERCFGEGFGAQGLGVVGWWLGVGGAGWWLGVGEEKIENGVVVLRERRALHGSRLVVSTSGSSAGSGLKTRRNLVKSKMVLI